MTFNDEVERDRRRKAEAEPQDGGDQARPAKRTQPPRGEYGSTLRSVYQATVQEDIPSEMLDLLGKLG